MKYVFIIAGVLIFAFLAYLRFSKLDDSLSKSGNSEARILYEEGLKHLENKNYEEALNVLEQSLEIEESENTRAAFNKALGFIGPM